jgi:hypothetical protein
LNSEIKFFLKARPMFSPEMQFTFRGSLAYALAAPLLRRNKGWSRLVGIKQIPKKEKETETPLDASDRPLTRLSLSIGYTYQIFYPIP